MSSQLAVRLSSEEKELVEAATELEKQPGDRGGASAWARRAILREAKRVVDAAAVRQQNGEH